MRPVARRLLSAQAAIALACLVVAGYLALEARDAERVERANELGLAGDYDAAVAQARRVSGAPAEVRALLAEANAHWAAGRLPEASAAFGELAERDPNNWTVHSEWARVLLALGDRAGAQQRIARAKQLNPRLALPPELSD